MDMLVENRETKGQSGRRIKRGLISILLALILMMTTMGAYYVHAITEDPALLFEPVTLTNVTASPSPAPLFDVESYLPAAKAGVTPIPTVEPKEKVPEADMDPLAEGKPPTGIVNIALFGIDAFEDGRTTSGTMVHSDVNMIMAINFDAKEVSLISIARDAFTNIPGHSGFYKFNGVFNVGGGLEDPHGGLKLSCRTAEMWLEGISVPYYYCVDFQALIVFVDALGGIDYDLDIPIHTFDGHSYPVGLTHLDGQGVMGYVRMRKTAGGLDYLRTDRQRRMLIAIYRMIKEQGKLSQIPDIAKAMEDKVYTNLSVAQIAAIVDFAREVDPDNVHPYSFHGGMYERFDWRYCFIFQQDRIDILKKVYGIDAQPIGVNSPVYEKFLNNRGYLALQHIGYARLLFDAIHSTVSPEQMTEEQKKLYAACWKDYTDLQAEFELASEWTKANYDENIEPPFEERQKRYEYYSGLVQIEERLRRSGDALNKAFGDPVQLKWLRNIRDWYQPGSVINEVYVDFA